MTDYIATDADGNVVGKWRRHERPKLPDIYSVKEVEDVANHSVDYWWDEQS